MKYGIQLYGARELFKRDPAKFFETVAEMGYTSIEACLVADTMPAPMVNTLWRLEDVPGYLKIMESLGLEMTSFHAFGLEDRMVEIYEKFGAPHFVVHCGNVAEDFEKRLDFIGRLYEDVHSAGAQLWLHNGAGDCVPGKVDGMCYYKALIRKIPGLQAEFDNGWGIMDGADQYAIMETLGDALGCLHLKEVAAGWEAKPMGERFALPGEGMSDFDRLLTINAGRDIILDEDFPVKDWYTDFSHTIEYLKARER